MKYYINNEAVDYDTFRYYLIRSIKYQVNFSLSNKEVHEIFLDYYNDMKYRDVSILFKDKLEYKIR